MPFSDSESIKEAVERNRHPELTLAHELLPGIREETVYRSVAYADVLYGLSTGNVYSSSRFRYATGLSASKNTLVLFFHGNAENISSHFISAAWIADRGYDLMMFDYRRFGRSDGEVAHSDVLRSAHLR